MANRTDKKRTQYLDFTKPVIKQSKGVKYVEYHFRIPEDLRPQYQNRRFKRFKVYEEINRRKTDEYAIQLRDAVEQVLNSGYNPFAYEQKFIKEQSGEFAVKEWTIQQAVLYFVQKWMERGLEITSFKRNERTAKRFLAWIANRNLQHQSIDILNVRHIEAYLSQSRESKKWSNRSYNNELAFLNTLFNFLVKYSVCKKNPCTGIDKLVSITKKHRYYDEKLFAKVKGYLATHDPYLLFACQVVYYLCIRSEKELKYFKVGNIFPDRKQVLITAADSKTNSDRYIPCCDEMMNIFKERKILDYPPNHYVFAVPHKNKFIADGKPGTQSFGNGFFSKRFRKVREDLGLTEDHTLFGFRHTRAVHLKLDGANDVDIQHLMGHTDFATTAKYLRDIGLSVNAESLNAKSRKF